MDLRKKRFNLSCSEAPAIDFLKSRLEMIYKYLGIEVNIGAADRLISIANPEKLKCCWDLYPRIRVSSLNIFAINLCSY